jgi:tRNA(Ile)-lysidine synthase
MTFGAAVLRAVLEEHLPERTTGLLVALSGGADSACLLTALLHIDTPLELPLRAVHIDHGLQSASLALREAAAALCEIRRIPFKAVTVRVDTAGGESLEAAARDARYRALAHELQAGECLLTAHHAQDQAETLMLQLLRGAGLKGLSGMPLCRRFANGWHLRPLLEVTKRELQEFFETYGIRAADDPMNHDPRFDRSHLRSAIWPLIERRWPGAASALARTAGHIADAQTLLDGAAAAAVERLRDGEALSVPGLRALPEREQVNALRHWLSSADVTPPPAARLSEALRQVLTADADHLPAVEWGGFALRRYRDRLFVTAADVAAIGAALEWRTADGRLELGAGLGTLRWAPQPGGLDVRRLPDTLQVRRRSGGESMKIGALAKTHTVQHLCQAMGVLPWMRDALPMVYADENLIAVGDIWQDVRWRSAAGEPGLGCVWENSPNLT